MTVVNHVTVTIAGPTNNVETLEASSVASLRSTNVH